MSICWTRLLDQHFAAPRSATDARDRRSDASAGSVPPPREVLDSAAFASRDISPGAGRLGGWRSGFSSAGWPRRTPKAVRRQPAVLSEFPLSHVRVLTRDEAAAVHDGGAARSHVPANNAGCGNH